MAERIVIPMIVLARYLKNPLPVPALDPNYKTALRSYLGKDATPAAFNTNLLLKRGVHLHFVLPSALKKGHEVTTANGDKTMDYPAVPDRYLVTRMYIKNHKIETESHIVESNFYSLDDAYSDSITIPKFDDLRARHRFRYMGRTYPANGPAPEPVGECGYFDRITAMGPGNPMFSAYYPSCSSVFGFYDSLEGVPADAVLTYCVTGIYSDPANDLFHQVQNADDMKKVLADYDLSLDRDGIVCRSSMVFGVAGGINLSHNQPVPVGEINVGIGRNSAEALSAIISEKHFGNQEGMERFLTSVQYDTADEASSPDGDFKIDDDIHYRGFSRLDPIERAYSIKLPKDAQEKQNADMTEPEKQYAELSSLEREIGKLRRMLEYQKESFYCLWELYEEAGSKREEQIRGYMDPLAEAIGKQRRAIHTKLTEAETKKNTLANLLAQIGGTLEAEACEPFFRQGDPALMLFGEGMNRTYAFGEDGRFEEDGTLLCLTGPLTADISEEEIISYFANPHILEQNDYVASALLLDQRNLLSELGLSPMIRERVSPVAYNGNPMEQVTLLMQWETVFYPDYTDAVPTDSVLQYGDTDYIYQGCRSQHGIHSEGVTVLTPHGVYHLQEQLEKYLTSYSDDPEIAALAGKIRDLAAVSQSLGGFSANLCGLAYAFQFPVAIDPKDAFAREAAACISPEERTFYEPEAERLAVRDNAQIFPLREGYFGLSKLAMVSSFGEQRRVIDDELAFRGKRYISENLQPVQDGLCFFPLALTSAARLTVDFVSAKNQAVFSSPFQGSSPVIGIFLPDMLNRNLNVFSGSGERIGVLKTAYRMIGGKKRAVGRFLPSPDAPETTDSRLRKLIDVLAQDTSAFAEVMETIDIKLNGTLPLSQNHFVFGRALVLAEVAVELEYYGAPHWSKRDEDIGSFDDVGLAAQEFPVMFGDRNRSTDGVCCGFTQDFEHGFAAFGAECADAEYLNAPAVTVSGAGDTVYVPLLLDPMLKVTVTTGILPVKQVEICGEHVDFSQYHLCAAELNTVLAQQTKAELPEFAKGANYSLFYPTGASELRDEDNEGRAKIKYEEMTIVNNALSIGEISGAGSMIIDGLLAERRK
ncbi:MAG: hypothetical protein K2O65_01905 [Lachnospiraceae bacterium]|nr:hypothetical protein [Lachnospiraceae bacterium]